MLTSFLRSKWYDPAAIPIYVTMVVAVAGAGGYLVRLATSPDVAVSRANPHPWLAIDKNADPRKFMVVSKEYYAKRREEAGQTAAAE